MLPNYPILHAKVILDITQVLPILLNITNITNITQYHQYYTILQIQYSPILLKITYYSIFHWWYSVSILLKITNITQYYLFNITQYS